MIYDLIVVGAGIHGAGVAQAAAAKGLSVLVIERHAEAGQETSSHSSKLIHGGLRYLETGQLRLVRECLRERRILLDNAPGLVSLQPFYIPVYRGSARSPFWVGLGLVLYSVLGGLDSSCRFRYLPKSEWAALDVEQEGLRAVFQYFDGQTDDCALTQGVMVSAQNLGAQVRYATTLIDGRWEEGRFLLRLAQNGEQGEYERVQGRSVVNAAGPWANQVAQSINSLTTVELDWVQGSHLVLNVPSLSGCFYIEAPSDQRAVFVLPWRGVTLVGTTERSSSSPEAGITEEEIDYLLSGFNHAFASRPCTRDDILETFSGVRVLPAGPSSANRRSRETYLHQQREGDSVYLAIYGGKLTSYRATAEKVVNRIAQVLGVRDKRTTASIPLTAQPNAPSDKA